MNCVCCGEETLTKITELERNGLMRNMLWHMIPVVNPPFCCECMKIPVVEVGARVRARHPPRIGMGGSRQWINGDLIHIAVGTLRQLYGGKFVIVYGAHWEGADAIIKEAAEQLKVPLDPFPADWERYEKPGRKNPAGQIRNEQMAKSGLTMHLAFRSKGKSSGTDGMCKYCFENHVPAIVVPEAASESFLYRLLTALQGPRSG